MAGDTLTVGIAQIAPVWLDRDRTLAKIVTATEDAARQGADLVAFGEALLPGYPLWVERTDGARFESPLQKAFYARYTDQAVDVSAGGLAALCEVAANLKIAVYVGVMEKDPARRGQSVFCSMVYIDATGSIGSVHRKLMPTHEERLVWAAGDGNGLRTHRLPPFTVGGLNCWENWLPLARASLYGQGEDLHVAIWPGSRRNTEDITRFIAKESRSYVLSVSGLMRKSDIPTDMPDYDSLLDNAEDVMTDGGSCLALPTGDWLIEPLPAEEIVTVATIDHAMVRRERHSLDITGHYSRADVTKLYVNRERLSTVKLSDE
ncbi:MAG: carbon-nitrogen hydrolase family protein [Woeseiaceae bacterium]|nr:carbon-nitrogen hydrolase family protein [Woeseiaceae bacterium]